MVAKRGNHRSPPSLTLRDWSQVPLLLEQMRRKSQPGMRKPISEIEGRPLRQITVCHGAVTLVGPCVPHEARMIRRSISGLVCTAMLLTLPSIATAQAPTLWKAALCLYRQRTKEVPDVLVILRRTRKNKTALPNNEVFSETPKNRLTDSMASECFLIGGRTTWVAHARVPSMTRTR